MIKLHLLLIVFTMFFYNCAAIAKELPEKHEKGLISNPVGKTKSVLLTEKGQKKSEESFKKLFAKS